MKINKPFTKLFDHPFLSNMVEETINLYNRFSRSKEVIKEFYGVDIGEVKLPIKPIFRLAKKRHLVLNEKQCKACGIQSYLIKDIGTMYNRIGTMHRAQADYEAVSVALRTAKFNKELVIVGDTIGFKNPESATSIRTDIYPDRKTMQIDVVEKFLTIIHSLIFFERLFPDQKFVKYFNAKKYITHAGNCESEFMHVHATINILERPSALMDLCDYPKHDRIIYLLWKYYMKDFCEHQEVVATRRPLSFLLKAYFEHGNPNVSGDLRHSIWWKHWNGDKITWFDRVYDADGIKHDVITHMHEVQENFSETENIIPYTIKISPKKLFHEFYLKTLNGKRKRLNHRIPFVHPDISMMKTRHGQIIPIKDSIELINEGRIMKHCIGGESYGENGEDGDSIFFRFIPSGVSKDNVKEQYTVTMTYQHEPFKYPDMDGSPSVSLSNVCYYDDVYHDDEGDVGYYFSEAWGWDNKEPSHENLAELHRLIFDNQDMFHALRRDETSDLDDEDDQYVL